MKIGLTGAPREVDLEVEDAEKLSREITEALDAEVSVVWVTAIDGRRHGIVVEKIAYMEWEPDTERRIGFVRG